MSDSGSSERLRLGALAMLADGNPADAVAHVLGVPLDSVLAWRDGRPLPADADEPPASAPAPVRRAPPRVRFNDELSHAMPAALRRGILAVCVVMAVVVTSLAVPTFGAGDLADGSLMLVVMAVAVASVGRLAQRSLVLGTDSVVVPRMFGGQAMAYSDIAGYDIEQRALQLGMRTGVPGRMLTLHSRRPGAAPLVAFIADGNAVDPRIFQRLGEATQANRDAPPLPPLAGKSLQKQAAARRRPFVSAALILALGAASLWPLVSVNVRTLWHGTPPLSALRHIEGPVNGASACWNRSRDDGGLLVATVGIGRGAGAQDVIVPCLFDAQAILHGGPHQLAVDVDPAAVPVPVVYQMSLDGRVLLAYEEAQARQRHVGRGAALVGVVVPLAGLGFMAFVLWLAWRGASGRVATGT